MVLFSLRWHLQPSPNNLPIAKIEYCFRWGIICPCVEYFNTFGISISRLANLSVCLSVILMDASVIFIPTPFYLSKLLFTPESRM